MTTQTDASDKARHAQVQLRSDTDLYDKAREMVAQWQATCGLPDNAQLSMLTSASRDWATLKLFVDKQVGREWTDRKAYLKEVYTLLNGYLFGNTAAALATQLRTWHFLPDSGTKIELKQQTERWGGALAREFIQHLACEVMFARWKADASGDAQRNSDYGDN